MKYIGRNQFIASLPELINVSPVDLDHDNSICLWRIISGQNVEYPDKIQIQTIRYISGYYNPRGHASSSLYGQFSLSELFKGARRLINKIKGFACLDEGTKSFLRDPEVAEFLKTKLNEF